MIIGAGPIVIGQAAEFDYSGSQAVKALKAEGYRVIVVNSNPATIMTDPELADATYIEPITPEIVEKIIAKERPDALLPTMGGQTALNTALTLNKTGVLEKYGKGTPNDWIERALLTPLNWVGILVMLVADVYLFGFFVGPIVWGVQMIWIPFWAAGIINGVGHALGYRNFEVKDESRNISPIAIWLGGEELHNNHHADPHSAKFKAKWYEFDVGWFYIRLLSLIGLAKVQYARATTRT